MSNSKFILNTLLLIILQLVIFNNIQLHSYVYVNVYILSIFLVPYGYRPIPVLFFAFLLGLGMDISNHTFGVHAAATTLLAYIRPRMLVLTSTREQIDDVHGKQSINNFGWFLKYVVLMTFIYNVVLITTETFSFSNFLHTTLRIICSTVVSLLFIITYYFIGVKKRQF